MNFSDLAKREGTDGVPNGGNKRANESQAAASGEGAGQATHPLDAKQPGDDDNKGVEGARDKDSRDQNKAADIKPKGEQTVTSDTSAENVESGKYYASTEAPNYKVGKFQFSNGSLHLTDSGDISEFEKILDGIPARERQGIKTVDLEAAEARVRARSGQSGLTRAFDSSVGRSQVTVDGQKIVGTDALEDAMSPGQQAFAKVAQMDANRPIDGTAVINDAVGQEMIRQANEQSESQQ